MSYIYKITNNVTGMSYVGNTSYDIHKRWHEHCRDSKKARCAKRPLYQDMQKYGTDKFCIGIIEECEASIAQAREVYWINKLNTFRNGYNCTIGGEGKSHVDYSALIKIYSETKSITQTAKMLEISIDTVSNFLHETNVKPPNKHEISVINDMAKGVEAISLNGNTIERFDSIYSATQWIMDTNPALQSRTAVRNNISRVCKNKGQTAYGIMWRFI